MNLIRLFTFVKNMFYCYWSVLFEIKIDECRVHFQKSIFRIMCICITFG